jgi:bacteriocin-like protein
MEEILREPEREPEELTESELSEIAGGWGCCGCCGPSVSLELELSLCL